MRQFGGSKADAGQTSIKPRRPATESRPPVVARSGAPFLGAGSLLQLQRRAGNEAVRGALPIQRLMRIEDFKRSTPGAFRSRSGVAAMDNELEVLSSVDPSLPGTAVENMLKRQVSLRKLRDLCTSYGGKRSTGVGALAREVKYELEVVDRYALAAVQLKGTKEVPSIEVGYRIGRQIFEAQDHWTTLLQQQLVGKNSDIFSGIWSAYQQALGGKRKEVAARLIEYDLQKLEEVANAESTDPLVAGILKEALRNKDDVTFAETGGVASNARVITGRDKPEHQQSGKKYLLETQMAQNAGSVERESTLLHELIHIAVQEKFGNTAVHLAFNKKLSEEEVKELSDRRTQQINDLEGLKGNLQGVLGPTQYSMFDGNSGKILYCLKGNNTLGGYANRLGAQGRITQEEKEYILRLEARGCNNTLAEFDTSISQMAYALERWGIPKNNEFRVALERVAREAYEHRGSMGG